MSQLLGILYQYVQAADFRDALVLNEPLPPGQLALQIGDEFVTIDFAVRQFTRGIGFVRGGEPDVQYSGSWQLWVQQLIDDAIAFTKSLACENIR